MPMIPNKHYNHCTMIIITNELFHLIQDQKLLKLGCKFAECLNYFLG